MFIVFKLSLISTKYFFIEYKFDWNQSLFRFKGSRIQYLINKIFQAISYGTIPYLGTFLTDLTMIDTAISDTVADGLINFDKRRKEFEVLAQVTFFSPIEKKNFPQYYY